MTKLRLGLLCAIGLLACSSIQAMNNGEGADAKKENKIQEISNSQVNLEQQNEQKQDFEKELEECKVLALKGDLNSQLLLGYTYGEGKYVTKNRGEAQKYLMMAYEQGDLSALNMLGMYYLGLGNATQVYWTMAAEKGYAPAQYNLAWFYENNHRTEEAALKYYKMALEQGFLKAKERIELLEKRLSDRENHRFIREGNWGSRKGNLE